MVKKKVLSVFFSCTLSALVALAFTSGGVGMAGSMEDGLIFYAPFDGTIDAAQAGGSATGSSTLEPRFEEGLRGQALVIGGDPRSSQSIKDELPVSDKKPRNAIYQTEGNLDMLQGTLSLWVKPLDWSGDKDGFNVLFYGHAGSVYFQLYKFFSDNRLLLLAGEQEKWTSVVNRIGDWAEGEWHHLAVSWNRDEMCMYHNGHLVCRSRVRFPMTQLEKIEPFAVGPGGDWSHAFTGHSLVDELRIYNRPLTPGEVQTLYLAEAGAVEHSYASLVLGENKPAQNGKIEDGQYSFDTRALAAPGQLQYSPETSRLALSFAEKTLYLAVLTQVEMDASDGDDEVVLFLAPDRERIIDLAFDPAGKVSNPAGNAAQMESVITRSSVANGKWLLEAAIPFAVTGSDALPEAGAWRMNVVRRYGSDKDPVSFAPIAGSEMNRAHYFALTFDAEAPRIRVGDWTDYAEDKTGQHAQVMGAKDDVVIQAEYVSDSTKQYGLRSRAETLYDKGKYTPYRGGPWKYGAGADFSVNQFRIVEKHDEQSRILYEKRSIFERVVPLSVEYIYMHDARQLRVSAQHGGVGSIRARFLKMEDGAMADASGTDLEAMPEIWRSEQPYPENSKFFTAAFDLDFSVIKPDLYLILVEHVAADGTSSPAWQQGCVVPSPEHPAFHPYVDPEADLVPAPWTAVEVGGKWTMVGDRNLADTKQGEEIAISTWGRKYGISEGLLFDSLVTQSEELLAAPMRLSLNGETLVPQEAVTELEQVADIAGIIERRVRFDKLSAVARLVTHFDGYCEIDLELQPPSEGLEVGKLALEIPIRGEKALLVRDAQISALTGSKAGAVGDYWHQRFRGGQGGAYFWVGGGRVGLNWVVRDLDAWQNRDENKQVEMVREGDTVTVRLNLIDSEQKLDSPLTYRLGFTLTPSRPLDKRILRRREMKEFQMWCQPWQYFAVPDYDTASIGTIKYDLGRAEPGADEVFLYLGVDLTSPFVPERTWFVEEWLGPQGEYGKWTGSYRDPAIRNRTTYAGAGLHNDTFFNWMQHTRAVFFEKAKTPLIPEAHSYYFDTGPSVNSRYREQAINVYRMIRRTGPRARVYAHQGMQRVMPFQNFTDIICGGEGLGTRVVQDGNYHRVLTPEMFRASYCPYLYGIKMVFIDMTVRSLKEQHPQLLLRFDHENPEFRKPLLHSYGYCMVHDVDIHDSNVQSKPLRELIWGAQDALGWDENVEFHPYWENDTVKRLGDDIGLIMASAYSKDGRMILAVLNDTDEERTVELALDLEKLGVEAGAEGRDLWEPELKYVLDSTWSDRVPPRGCRTILWQ